MNWIVRNEQLAGSLALVCVVVVFVASILDVPQDVSRAHAIASGTAR